MSEIDELIAHLETQETTPTVDRLISKVKEQDREIAGLKEKGMWEAYDRAFERGFVSSEWKERAEKAEADLKILVGRERSIINARDVHLEERRRAEAELEAQLITYQAKIKEIDALEARVKELEELLGEETYAERAAVRHYKRIKELEQELLWAAEACEKAETENSILRGLSQKGTIDRGSFAKHATETVETSEETRRLLAKKEKV